MVDAPPVQFFACGLPLVTIVYHNGYYAPQSNTFRAKNPARMRNSSRDSLLPSLPSFPSQDQYTMNRTSYHIPSTKICHIQHPA
jgi:hypothetical protein